MCTPHPTLTLKPGLVGLICWYCYFLWQSTRTSCRWQIVSFLNRWHWSRVRTFVYIHSEGKVKITARYMDVLHLLQVQCQGAGTPWFRWSTSNLHPMTIDRPWKVEGLKSDWPELPKHTKRMSQVDCICLQGVQVGTVKRVRMYTIQTTVSNQDSNLRSVSHTKRKVMFWIWFLFDH